MQQPRLDARVTFVVLLGVHQESVHSTLLFNIFTQLSYIKKAREYSEGLGSVWINVRIFLKTMDSVRVSESKTEYRCLLYKPHRQA